MTHNKQIAKTIMECMKEKYIMSIIYKRDTDNKHINRQVEPYEIKRLSGTNEGYLYAYDRTGNVLVKNKKVHETRTIKSFLLNNIIAAKKQKVNFVSRY